MVVYDASILLILGLLFALTKCMNTATLQDQKVQEIEKRDNSMQPAAHDALVVLRSTYFLFVSSLP